MNKRTLYIGLTALSLGLGGGLYALAQSSPPAQPGPQQTQRTNYREVFLQKLATALGVDVAKLKAALQSAGIATVDEALKNKDLTPAQADRAKQRIQSGDFGLRGFGGPGMERGGRGFGMERQGFRGGPSAGLEAAAKALNTSVPDLVGQLRSGKTLTQIAQSKNVDPQVVKDAVINALKGRLSQMVSAGRLTQAQADQILAKAQQDPNFGLFGGHRSRR
ncbi:MAG: hypothetical protein K6T57_08475 [Thermaceae bacterium]|nr:hypothetical protein [Thermaceae bacterium]